MERFLFRDFSFIFVFIWCRFMMRGGIDIGKRILFRILVRLKNREIRRFKCLLCSNVRGKKFRFYRKICLFVVNSVFLYVCFGGFIIMGKLEI